ncbi:MAG: hypothetical protein ABTA23_07970 [Solibacillus sp.]
MTYKKPTCDCGANLKYSGDAYVVLSIKSDGTLSRYKPFLSTAAGGHLWCMDCKNYYAYEVDSKERILRGQQLRVKD